MPEIVLPSGMIGQIRKLKGRDGRFMADQALSRSGAVVDHVLKACWEQTNDGGIYKIADGQAPDWSKTLIGDRDYTLIQIATATYGNEYEFYFNCKACAKRQPWTIDCSLLPVRKLSDASKETFLEGNRFEETIPDDKRKVWFRLVTGGDAARARTHMKELFQKQKQNGRGGGRGRGARVVDEVNMLIEAVSLRTIEIEGVEKHPKAKREYLEDLDMDQITELLDRYDEHDCGVETSIEVECNDCNNKQETNLPFDEDFFFRRKKKVVRNEGEETTTTETEEEPEP